MSATTAATATTSELSIDRFPALLAQLTNPEAFPFAVAAGEPVVIQTHASAVLLAGNRAYKVKKPVNFGFFDFSTPALRRTFCLREVMLNARLAPSVYLGVAAVLALPDGRVCIGRTLPPSSVPQPGSSMDGGTVIDYAVVMRRLPEEATLQARVAAGTADVHLLRQVARQVAAFHGSARTSAEIASFGDLSVIRRNWDENLDQMRPQIGRLLDQETFDAIERYVYDFLRARAALLANRVQDGHVRNCHGDLRLQHVYALGSEPDPGRHLVIIDGIEFNERFRYGDVAAEVAFLAMELDAARRRDLVQAFLTTYIEETGDEALRELLPFYLCYRACVRGKVAGFQLNEPEVPPAQCEVAEEQARSLYALARHYAQGRTRPALVLVGGTMGTGKSTLASRLHHALGWPLLSSDLVRKRLARLNPQAAVSEPFGQGIYSAAWTEQTYGTLLEAARSTLDTGRSVLLDATYGRSAFRLAAAQVAREHGAQAVLVECHCTPEVAKGRLAERWRARTNRPPMTAAADGRAASDGRPELYDLQAAAWEPYDPIAEAELSHSTVSTMRPAAETLGQVIAELGTALHGDLGLEVVLPNGRNRRDIVS